MLTGQAPGALKAELAATAPIPAGPTTLAVGIPADALRQRPDVRAAERRLAAATAQIGVAEAQLYPALGITGNIGTAAASIGNLTSVITGGLFAGLSQLIFDGGRTRSQVRSQEAAAEAAFAAYKQTVLNALEDVENALTALQTAKDRQVQFSIALDASNNSAILSRSQYRAGLTDITTLNNNETACFPHGTASPMPRPIRPRRWSSCISPLAAAGTATAFPWPPRSPDFPGMTMADPTQQQYRRFPWR